MDDELHHFNKKKEGLIVLNTLKVITQPKCTDLLRPVISVDGSLMVLFNPQDKDYGAEDKALCYKEVPLSMHKVVELAGNSEVNRNLQEPILLIGLWSFLYDRCDLRNKTQFATSVAELSRYLGISVGGKGYRLTEKLESFANVYGIIPIDGVFRLLEIERIPDDKLILRSEYLHRALNIIIRENYNVFEGKRSFYTDKAFANLVAAKNKTAALIVIELVNLVVSAGLRVRKPHISLNTLAERIPQLFEILYSKAPLGIRNKQLRRAIKGVVPLLMERTSLSRGYVDLEIYIPSSKDLKPKSVIEIRHKGKHKKSNFNT